MMKSFYLKGLLGFIILVFFSCDENTIPDKIDSSNNQEDTTKSNEWLIPKEDVFDGGPGKDGIPSIDNPTFINVQEVDFLEPNDLVAGIKIGSQIKAYPHKILNWHEIVNDKAGNENIAMTYCPLTGTAIAWDRKISGEVTTFGVSGLLYNANLIPYDRQTDSHWSQMRMDCVNGKLKGKNLDTYQVVETKWETWKTMYPQSKVLSTQTGYDRDYSAYPYGDYQTNSQLLFPVEPEDDRLFVKERVLGIIEKNEAQVFRFQSFTDSIRLVTADIQGNKFLIVGSEKDNFIVSFKKPASSNLDRKLYPVQNSLPVVIKDNKGNKYDIFGNVVSGNDQNLQLAPAKSFMGFWFSWGAFYPKPEIHSD